MENQIKKAAALKYKKEENKAPLITAKGSGVVAEKIIETAKKAGIPVKEDKNLVQILSSLDLYQEIPPELYKAVAEILAFVYKLQEK